MQLSLQAFEGMFAEFEHKRERIAAYVGACPDGAEADVWARMGFDAAKDVLFVRTELPPLPVGEPNDELPIDHKKVA